MMKNLIVIVMVALCAGLTSCLKSNNEDEYSLLLRQVEEIDEYLAANNLNAIEQVSGVRMVISELGTGFPANPYSTVDVDYVGKLFTTNEIFDQGNATGAVTGYIEGWKDALYSLPAGSKAMLYIPAALGYRGTPKDNIPANSILVFDIVFNEVQRSSLELQKLTADTVAIDTYLASKSITAIKDTTGLRYVITELGNGDYPTIYDKVEFHVAYRLLTDDSKVVGEYDLVPTTTFYNRVIDQNINGLKLGLTKIGVGAKARFYVPSGLGFGPQGAVSGSTQVIPANANIIVDVTLNKIDE
ncbi:MAG TPA: FKBP-type peptidyl-prolyl cis-trans isomerase [Chryseolinea sp.]|nr:FKBP-type peptidyl-prolyl cis-trans isomerase [Chryseolinea sp.]